MNSSPFVSVIIPTYNRKNLIVRAVDSVLNQSFRNFELLVIDDGSADGTESVMTGIQDNRLRYLPLPENGGPAKARNEGIRLARGEYIAFLDSDDAWRKDKLQKQLEMANQGFQAVFCKYLIHGDRESRMPVEMSFDVCRTEHGFLDILLDQNKIGTPTLLISRAVVERIGGFNESFSTYEDWEYALRIAEVGPIGYLPEVLVDVYPTQGGVNSQSGKSRVSVLMHMLRRYWNAYENKKPFDNIIRYIYNELADGDLDATAVRRELFAITGTDWVADYTCRQMASIWRVLSEHNDAINEINRTISDIVTILDDRTVRIAKLEKRVSQGQ